MSTLNDETKTGWGTIREIPWHFAGLFASQAGAQRKADEMGEGYIVRYGDHQIALDTFTSRDEPQGSAMPGSIFEPRPTAPDKSGRLAAVAAWIDEHIASARGGH